MFRPMIFLVSLFSFLLVCCNVHAHPVPKNTHDRIVAVKVAPDAILVEYQLEVDEWTLINNLVALLDREELAALNGREDCYKEFVRRSAPLLADNLITFVDDKPLTFSCEKQGHEVLDHIRCNFRFRAPLPKTTSPAHQLTLLDSNYKNDGGRMLLAVTGEPHVELLAKSEPSEALKNMLSMDRQQSDDEKLRKASARFRIDGEKPPATTEQKVEPIAEPIVQEASADAKNEGGPVSLLGLLFDTKKGLLLLLMIAAGLGAIHALTPGHGKTLVAAYLVGENGTTWHAILLGIVTTLTHTGVVLIVAALLPILFQNVDKERIQTTLELCGGLLVAGLGFWLLLNRLSGRADHVHLGGNHHHHHHHHGDHHVHDHCDHSHDEQHEPAAPVRLFQLIMLGIQGGIVPCPEAIVMLGVAVSAQRLWLGLPLLLAFSAGLAGVLVAIGIMVVHAKGFGASRWGESRMFKALPIISAVVVTCLGLWLCYDSVHGEKASTQTPVSARP